MQLARKNMKPSDAIVILDEAVERDGTININDAISIGIPRHTFYSFVKQRSLVKEKSGHYSIVPDYLDRYKIAQEKYPKIIYSWATAVEMQHATENISPKIFVSIPSDYSIRAGGLPDDFICIRESKETYGIGTKEITSWEGSQITVYSLERCFCDFISKRFYTIDREQYFKFLRNAALNGLINERETFDIAEKLNVFGEVYYAINLIMGQQIV